MDEDAIFKRYDIRGKYPKELNEEFAEKIGKSIGTFTKRKNYESKIVVTKDSKDSSKKLKDSLIKGITSTGCKVLEAGTGPTDYTAFTGNRNEAVSVQVTSSHLPSNFNGFKFMYPEGNGFTNPDLDKVKQFFRDGDLETGEADVKQLESGLKEYKKDIKSFLEQFETDFDKKIVVDTLGGATHPVLIELLEELGAEVTDLAENKEEMPYRDPPNPKPENLEEMKQKVRETNADMGIATDMDGDRVTVYRNGFLSGDDLFGVFAQLLDSNIVASIDTSKAVENLVESAGRKIEYTRVGDPFVMDKAIKERVKLAGEPNGHYAFPDFVPYPSGTVASLIVAGVELDQLISKLPEYHVERISMEVENKNSVVQSLKEEVEQRYELESEVDGIKFNDGHSTVLVRPSGSSPKIRMIIESEDAIQAEELAWKTQKMIRNA